MNKKKILITGFPHTGTSILKSKFGECFNVYEAPWETEHVRGNEIGAANHFNKDAIVIKYSSIPIEIHPGKLKFLRESDNPYKDYNIIFLTRNPWYLFTSVIKSGINPVSGIQNHFENSFWFQLERYERSAQLFLEAKNANIPGIYALRYEDFFDNNGEAIKNIMDDLGLIYESNIFDSRTKDYIHWPKVHLKDLDESNLGYDKNRWEYRTWQINQPFQNMNSDINITDELQERLNTSKIIQEIGYSDPRITH